MGGGAAGTCGGPSPPIAGSCGACAVSPTWPRSIGETDEAERCRLFLLQLDPSASRRTSRRTDPVLIGVVLTGGASRRMGRTKALLEVRGTPMASRVADALSEARVRVRSSCTAVIRSNSAPLDRPVLPDLHPGEGPLGGIVGVLEQFARPADRSPDRGLRSRRPVVDRSARPGRCRSVATGCRRRRRQRRASRADVRAVAERGRRPGPRLVRWGRTRGSSCARRSLHRRGVVAGGVAAQHQHAWRPRSVLLTP